MKSILKKFVNEPLFEACAALLEQMQIEFNEVTRMPVSFEDLYPQPIPKALQEVLDKVENTYFIGTIDEASLSGSKSQINASAVTNQASEGKYTGMMVFAAEISSDEKLTRTECATLTRGFNRIAAAQPVILFIKKGNEFALSTCERSKYTQQWRDGEKLGKVCILRGINCLNPHRGHLDILASIGDKSYPTFEELYKHWMQVFSSELLTKKFYSDLSDWYAWAVQVVRFPNDLTSTEDDDKFNHESCIRLITRLIFVWFLKQKHLIPEEFFDEKYIKDNFIDEFNPHDKKNLLYNPDQSKYYRLILQNLFFAMLNCPIVAEGKDAPNNRRFRGDGQKGYLRDGYNVNNLMRYKNDFKQGGAEKFVEIANTHVPFLNGELFECLDKKPEKLYYDGFSERKESLEQLYLPDWLFFGDEVGKSIDLSEWYGDNNKAHVSASGIIDILKKYNFTIEENTPLDQEVSLDPELLGKAFENLLASYNPETQTSARKQTGSFYTPREIVQYMVDESLIAHLKRTCGDELEPEYRKLLSYSIEDTSLDEEQRKSIMHALYNCRVLDPACGSGAFPMGILQQMVHVLRQLDPSNEMWKDFMIDLAIERSKIAYAVNQEEDRSIRLADIEEAFNESINDPDYARKLYLIEHCIYGVDIQPIAVQISKLRFFISLVVDQKPSTDTKQNFGIRPLPNLESKFVAANTLIPVNYEETYVDSTDEIIIKKKQLWELNHKVFLAKRNIDKQQLKEKIKETRQSLAETIEATGLVTQGAAQLLANWDMFDQNTSSSFFDAEWMFGVKKGFDIVIGNPPYVQLQNNGGELAKPYLNCGFLTFARTGDIYCLFYERGWQLLKEGGHLCYITSNKWMRAGYGEKTRNFFAKKTNPMLLIDFAGVKIFESATVDTNILLFSKGSNQHKTICAVTNKQNKDSVKKLSDFVQQQNSICDFATSDSWVILSPIEQSIKRKIEAVGTPLKDWDIKIYRGVLTGCNEAFIINSEKRDEILANCQTVEERQRTDELIRPILRGRDIKRYGYDWANLYLIATFPSRHYDIDKYPAVKQYLLTYGIERLEQTGKTHIVNGEKVKARKKTSNKWFETQDSISYWEDFNKPKVVYMEIQTDNPEEGYPFPCYSFDEKRCIVLNTAYIMSSETTDPRYVLGILNSKLGKFLVKLYVTQLQERQFRMLSQYVMNFPIARPTKEIEIEMSKLVHNVLVHQSKESENRIDELAFQIYKLSENEIKLLVGKQL